MLLLVLLLPATVPGALWAEEAGEPEHIAQAVGDLEALAAWCHKRKLFRERNATYEALLAFRPDHKDARKWLKYKQAKDGTWERRGRYKPPRNLKTPGPALTEKRQEIGARYAEAALAWLEAPKRGRSPAVRRQVMESIVLVDPNHARARRELGEVQTAEGAWLLKESLETPKRRAQLEAAARDAIAGVAKPRQARPSEAENAVGIGWKGIVAGSRARVASSADAAEATRAHALTEAAFVMFPSIYGAEPPHLPGLSLLIITSDAERTQLLAKHPSSTKAFQEFGATLSSGWFPQTNIVFARSAWPARRLEWATRQPLAALLRRAYKVRTKHGWAFEGFGLYASYLLCGRRQTFYVRRTKYGDKTDPKDDLWNRLTADGADWRKEARTLLASDRAPNLRLLLGKEVNTMNTEDMLLAYVFAAWLIEARPERVPGVLRAVARGRRADDLVEGQLRMDVDGLMKRLRRWLDETK